VHTLVHDLALPVKVKAGVRQAVMITASSTFGHAA
jgi:hypothetical protein